MVNSIFLNMVYASPQAELHAAHALKKVVEHGEVALIGCNQSIGACTLNPFGRSAVCTACIDRRNRLVDMVNIAGSGTVTLLEVVGDGTTSYDCPKKIRTGVLSGIASHTRAPDEKYLSPKWKSGVDRQCRANARLKVALDKLITEHEINSIAVFNGRFGCATSAIVSAKANQIDFEVYDLNRGYNQYCFKNISLHSVQENTRRALEHFRADQNKAEQVASKFYSDKRSGKPTYEKSYTLNQQKGILKIDVTKKILAVFTSSDDEYKYIGEDWDGGKVVDQAREVLSLHEELPDDFQIVVRMHPNQAGMPSESLECFYKLSSHGISVIRPEDRADTYELIDLASQVVTFCSLVGPEAVYGGKRVITIGPSPYKQLNIGINVETGGEAAAAILKGLYNTDVAGSIIWANYLMTYRDELPGFVNHGNGNCSVFGKRVTCNDTQSIGLLFAKIEIFLAKNNLFHLRTLKLARQRLMSFIDGRVRGEHQL